MLAAVADVMLKKILQESQLRQDPEFREDALLLLQNSFLGVQALLQEFGREAHADAHVAGVDAGAARRAHHAGAHEHREGDEGVARERFGLRRDAARTVRCGAHG